MINTDNRFSANGRSLSVYVSSDPARPGAIKLVAQDAMAPEVLLELAAWLKAKAETAIADQAQDA